MLVSVKKTTLHQIFNLSSYRYTAVVVLFVLGFGPFAQKPSTTNFKLNSDPYAQFNDIIEYKNELWFITNSSVCKLKKNKIEKLVQKENLSKFVVAENKLLVWSIYGEFYELNNNKLIPLPFNSFLTKRLENKIINSVEYRDSILWISSVIGSGLIKVDLRKESIKKVAVSESYPYYVFSDNGTLISGNNSNSTKKELAINLSPGFNIPLAENLSFSKTNVIKLSDGSFIFTRQYEAIRFNNEKLITRVFVEKNIEDIVQDAEGKIWMALNGGGVISYADANFNSSNAVKFFGNKTVISIAKDSKGILWFGTSGEGVYKLYYSAPIKYDAPKVFSLINKDEENIKSNLITTSLPEINTNESNIISTASTQILIPPSVFINEIKINGVSSELNDFYELSASKNNLEISISGIHKGKSELQYKYILEGIDSNWNYSASTTFYYSSLAPGNYTFKAFAMSDKGVWSNTPVVVTFNILPPFYQSMWFIFTIIFLVLIIILAARYLTFRKKELQNKRLEEEKRKALVSELHALRSQMNPHFIFNTLSSIQSFITQNNSETAVSYLSKFSKLMRSTLENTQQQKISIKDEIEMLSLYMDLEKLRLYNKFDYTITSSDDIDTQFDEIPPLLIQPFIENAIWHGISHKDGKGLIKINFELIDENTLKCTIEDNGVGREKAKEITAKHKKNKSLGMSITKERLEIINSLKSSALNVEITDLKENNEAIGTKIEIFIPLD